MAARQLSISSHMVWTVYLNIAEGWRDCIKPSWFRHEDAGFLNMNQVQDPFSSMLCPWLWPGEISKEGGQEHVE